MTAFLLGAFVAAFGLYLYRATKVAEREADAAEVRAELRQAALSWARERRDLELWEAQIAGRAER